MIINNLLIKSWFLDVQVRWSVHVIQSAYMYCCSVSFYNCRKCYSLAIIGPTCAQSCQLPPGEKNPNLNNKPRWMASKERLYSNCYDFISCYYCFKKHWLLTPMMQIVHAILISPRHWKFLNYETNRDLLVRNEKED